MSSQYVLSLLDRRPLPFRVDMMAQSHVVAPLVLNGVVFVRPIVAEGVFSLVLVTTCVLLVVLLAVRPS